MATTIYAGPGKLHLGAIGFQSDGENAAVNAVINEETEEIATAMHGRLAEQLVNQTVEITTKPFDDWALLPTLFPAYIGATVSGTHFGSVVPGTRPHGSSNTVAQIWTTDGRNYSFVRAALTSHPTLHLGVGKGLYGDIRVTCLNDFSLDIGDDNALFSAMTESGATEPAGAQMNFPTGFVREVWTGRWNASNFGPVSPTGSAVIQAEDEWTIETNVKYSELKVQGRTVAMKLDSAGFMARCKPVGPSHTDILGAIKAHRHGQRMGAYNLILTSNLSTKIINLQNAEIKGAGFMFGGTTLGTDEVGFVNSMTFSSGTGQPLITFT